MTTTMSSPTPGQSATSAPASDCSYSGWGRTNPATAKRLQPATLEQLQELVRRAGPASLIGRGQGRAYGDAAQRQGAGVIEMEAFDAIQLDADSGTVTAGGGATLEAILKAVVPAGFFLPVSPGTRYVSLGGAIAADVHGKNHHREGSFASHVQRLQLIDGNGDVRELSPDGNDAAGFWATAGGMGLTGVISEASFSLIPIETALIGVDTDRYGDLDALMAAMVSGDDAYRYSVAWVDSLHP
ncbi:MAG: FAD-binding oxidoreductase, partial [Prochlorococcaceae cyanobacterium]